MELGPFPSLVLSRTAPSQSRAVVLLWARGKTSSPLRFLVASFFSLAIAITKVELKNGFPIHKGLKGLYSIKERQRRLKSPNGFIKPSLWLDATEDATSKVYVAQRRAMEDERPTSPMLVGPRELTTIQGSLLYQSEKRKRKYIYPKTRRRRHEPPRLNNLSSRTCYPVKTTPVLGLSYALCVNSLNKLLLVNDLASAYS